MSTKKLPKSVPDNLSCGPIRLQFEKFITPEGHPELAPYYHFFIRDQSERFLGHINLRIGNSNHIQLVAGHIGYRVHREFRGSSYSYFACLALKPFVREHYHSIVITADRENAASNRIIEKLGAVFINEFEIPRGDPGFKEVGQIRRRYEWDVTEGH